MNFRENQNCAKKLNKLKNICKQKKFRGNHNIHRYLENNQKGARGRNRFGCAARLSQQLPLASNKI